MNRGFTVHSPFAFRFIRLVVREKLPYYDFDTITDPYDRLLYRTAVFFNPATVAAEGSDARHDLEIISRALPSAKIVAPSDAEFLCSDIPHPSVPVQFLRGKHSIPSATTFTLSKATIAVRRPGLLPANYPLCLPHLR